MLSWNVNGLRAARKKGFDDFLGRESPDILCLQETRVAADKTDNFEFPGYEHVFWNCAEKKGYSGTALVAKRAPLRVSRGLSGGDGDPEGRVITAEFERFHLVTVYTPNAQNHDESGRPRRLDYRCDAWEPAFRAHLERLDRAKPVVFCGDLNVAHREIDLARPKNNRRNAGFTDEERTRFSELLAAGFVDTFRHLYPDATDRYSWWSYRAGARKRNVGWRIDYFGVSERIADRVDDAFILDRVEGSDHCPVGVRLQSP